MMAWYSILPPYLTTFETWLVRFFIVLGLLTIGPWASLIILDFLFYVWRVATYEIPVIGGRARGRQKPRAPSLSERPSGHRRAFSLRGVERDSDSGSRPGSDYRDNGVEVEGVRDGDGELKKRNKKGIDG